MEEYSMFKRWKRLKKNKPIMFLAIVSITASGCQSVPTDVAAPKVEIISTESPISSSKGRQIYVSLLKCAMCHRPKPVYDYSREEWENDILPRMAKKARLKSDDYDSVLAYVTSHATQ